VCDDVLTREWLLVTHFSCSCRMRCGEAIPKSQKTVMVLSRASRGVLLRLVIDEKQSFRVLDEDDKELVAVDVGRKLIFRDDTKLASFFPKSKSKSKSENAGVYVWGGHVFDTLQSCDVIVQIMCRRGSVLC
jgi:hypothetical protein